MSPNGRAQAHEFTSTAATRAAIWLRFFLCGAGGSGKTYSALAIACALAERLGAGPVHVIDSEHGSALRYAKSSRTGRGFDFIHTPMPDGDYSPATYERALAHVVNSGARIILVDSISHEWDGANGCLEHVDRIAEAAEKSGRKPDNFSAWRTVTPMHRHFLESLLSLPAHVIVTMRAKMTYESRKGDNGRMKFEKVGLGPIQREGIEYESDIFGWLADATLTIDKTRSDRIDPGSVWVKPGADVAALLADWIQDSDPAVAPPARVSPAPRSAPTALESARSAWDHGDATDNDIATLAASPDANDRANVFEWRIGGAETAQALADIVRAVTADACAPMKADMLVLAEKRRVEIAGGAGGGA